MKLLVVFAVCVLGIHAATDMEQWSEFKLTHGKEYRNLIEEQTRFAIFQDNLRKIDTHNEKYEKGETSYYLGVTSLADLSKEEFLSLLTSTTPTLPEDYEVKSLEDISPEDVPASMDWRGRGVLTPVKNQGGCGSCWAFAATGALEAAYAIKTGNLVSLSEQNLVDCNSANGGCDGGTVHAAFDYVRDNGIEREEQYTYSAKNENCKFAPNLSVFRTARYVAIPYGSESELQNAVGTVTPVAVSINAEDFQLYHGGIIDDPSCSQDVNHAVLVVGYGSDNGQDYWLIKNSWGDGWGEGGFGKMSRNKDSQCGIALWAVYPVL